MLPASSTLGQRGNLPKACPINVKNELDSEDTDESSTSGSDSDSDDSDDEEEEGRARRQQDEEDENGAAREDESAMSLDFDLMDIHGEGDVVINDTTLRIHDWLGSEYEQLIVSRSF